MRLVVMIEEAVGLCVLKNGTLFILVAFTSNLTMRITCMTSIHFTLQKTTYLIQKFNGIGTEQQEKTLRK